MSLSAETFQETGIVNAEQLVNTLPQVVPSFSAGNNNPGGGQAYINLRGLGSNRNLVLVDATCDADGMVVAADSNELALAA